MTTNYLTLDDLELIDMGQSTDVNNDTLEQQILIAEQLINGYVNRAGGFQIEVITNEKHPFSRSGRVYPLSLPVNSITSFIIRVSSGNSLTIATTDLVINNNDGYIEATYSAVSNYYPSIQTELIPPIVELSYTAGYATVPKDVKYATAIVVGDLLADRGWSRQGLRGLQQVKIGASTMVREENPQTINPKAQLLLNKYKVIPIR